jgi:acetolactate synthase I/II/III large subunit
MAQGVKANKKLQLSTDSTWEIADLIVAYLAQLDVDYVFGIPGGAIEPFYNALARSARRGGPRPIVARHESDAAFMGDGYYRQSRKMAVCCSTTGPGATNMVTGVASAYANEIPMLVITAQTCLTNFGRRALQESSCTGINTVGMYEYITKYNTFVSHTAQLEHKLSTAIMQAHQSPFGPVHLSIPTDILRSPIDQTEPSYDLHSLIARPSLLDEAAVRELSRMVDEAGRIVIVIGEGCAESVSAIMEFALHVNACVVTTPHGKGLVSPYHPQFRGVVGFAGHSSANECLINPNVDLVIAVGTHLSEWASDGWNNKSILNSRLVHVDETESHLTGSPMGRLHVRGNILTVFQRVLDSLDTTKSSNIRYSSSISSDKIRYFMVDEEAKYLDDTVPIKPQRLMQALTDAFPPQTRYLADSGNSVAWAVHYLHPYDRRLGSDRRSRHTENIEDTDIKKRKRSSGQRKQFGGLFRASMEYASMGWAIGASIGTALGAPDQPVVCITGDGSVLMAGQELTVAVQEGLPVTFVILNDSSLGMVKHGQRMAKAEAVGFEIAEVDFAACARAMGAQGYVIESMDDFQGLDIDEICHRQGPTVLDVRIDAEEEPPIGSRLRVLGTVK